MIGCLVTACLLLSAPRPARGYVIAPDGARLYYEIVGRGPDVIVPAGFLVRQAFAPLAANYRLIFYDMRNRGRSSPVRDSTTLTVEQDVRDLETVRASLGVPHARVIGFSYLGLVVALYAMEHPDRVERVVQIGPVPLRFGTHYPDDEVARDEPVDSTAWADLQRSRRDGLPAREPRAYCEKEWRVMRVRLVGDQANVAATGAGNCNLPNEWPVNLERHFRFNFGSIQRLSVPSESLYRVRMPVLTIHGTRDRNAAYGSGREWVSRLPDARLLTVKGAAHMAWADAPELVLHAMRNFLGGTWPAAAERLPRMPTGARGDSAGVRADTVALLTRQSGRWRIIGSHASVLAN